MIPNNADSLFLSQTTLTSFSSSISILEHDGEQHRGKLVHDTIILTLPSEMASDASHPAAAPFAVHDLTLPASSGGVTLKPYQASYISLALSANILRFDGPFTLKSGRASPYFFNAGMFNTGSLVAAVASCYAAAIVESGIEFDVLFGPAYKVSIMARVLGSGRPSGWKGRLLVEPVLTHLLGFFQGIPLAATTAMALSREHGRDVGYCFNRKEAKAHGEGGSLVGAPLKGRILILDDVITAGTAIREAMSIISSQPEAKLAGVVIALDRQERATEDKPVSAIQEVEKSYGTQVVSVVNLDQIIGYLETKGGRDEEIKGMKAYRARYGIQKD